MVDCCGRKISENVWRKREQTGIKQGLLKNPAPETESPKLSTLQSRRTPVLYAGVQNRGRRRQTARWYVGVCSAHMWCLNVLNSCGCGFGFECVCVWRDSVCLYVLTSTYCTSFMLHHEFNAPNKAKAHNVYSV